MMAKSMQEKQTEMIKEHLDAGKTITSLEALNLFSCFRLASRMHDLKKEGYTFNKEMVKIGDGRKVARYSKGN